MLPARTGSRRAVFTCAFKTWMCSVRGVWGSHFICTSTHIFNSQECSQNPNWLYRVFKHLFHSPDTHLVQGRPTKASTGHRSNQENRWRTEKQPKKYSLEHICEPKSIPTNFSRNQLRAAHRRSHGMLHFTSCRNELPAQTVICGFSAPALTRGTGQIQHPAMNSGTRTPVGKYSCFKLCPGCL